MSSYITKEDICLNADKSAVVSCDSPDARWQLAAAGTMVSAEDARKYGLSAHADHDEPDAKADAEPEPDTKAVSKAEVEDKAVTKAKAK